MLISRLCHNFQIHAKTNVWFILTFYDFFGSILPQAPRLNVLEQSQISRQPDRTLQRRFPVWLITLVMVISFVLIFVFSLLEVVWLTVYDHDVVAHEGKSGGRTSATKAIRQLNDERMIVVGFILFAIHLLTYFTPLVLGRLSIDMDGGINAILAIYAVALFFFGEIVSKNIGYKYAMRSALLSAVPLRLLLWLCFPITWALRLTNRLTGG